MKFFVASAALLVAAVSGESLRANERDLLYVDQAYATSPQGNECEVSKGVWDGAPSDMNPCASDGTWKGKNKNKQNCPGSNERDVKLFIKTDDESEDNDSFFFSSDTGKGVPATNSDMDGDTLVRPIGTLKDDKYYMWEACLDAKEECFFFDYYTQDTSRDDFGFILISDGVLQLHMTTDDATFKKDSDKNNNDVKSFKRVSLGKNCPVIDKEN